MNILKLKGKMVEKGVNAEWLANKTGLSRSTLYRKLNDGEKMTVKEVMMIKDALNLSTDEAHEIFLS